MLEGAKRSQRTRLVVSHATDQIDVVFVPATVKQPHLHQRDMSNTGRITIARRLRSSVLLTPEECSVQLLNITAWPAGTGMDT
eukprot:COSAG01_NODE_35363_length_533_cov_0.686636_1_plen_82_part_10